MAVVVESAGVDTWSPAWYLDPESLAGRELTERATVPVARGKLLPDAIGGHRVGWDRGSGLLFAEGHPGGEQLHVPGGDGVGLAPALRKLVGQLLEADVPIPSGVARDAFEFTQDFHARLQGNADGNFDLLPNGPTKIRPVGGGRVGFAGVRRVDTTVNLATGSTAEGLAILTGVAAVCARAGGGTTAEVRYGLDGRVETVYMRGRSGRKILGRWYDKGLEAGAAPRGRLVRPEDQRRYPKAARRAAEELTVEYVRANFHRRFVPLWRASKGVTVAGPVVLAEKLLEAIEEGKIGAREAEAVAGHLLLTVAAGRRGAGVSRATMYRRERALGLLGLVATDGAMQEVEIDLHDVMEQALDGPCWQG